MEDINENNVETAAVPELRSMVCDIECNVVFKSVCNRKVDLYWIDYQGQRVKYATIKAGGDYAVNTFVTHPWMFRDAETGCALHGNGELVYMPIQNEDLEVPFVISVGIPVYRLMDICLEVLGKQFGDGNVRDLDIPVSLKLELLTHIMNKRIPFEVYEFAEL